MRHLHNVFTFKGVNLPRKDLFYSDPYFKIFLATGDKIDFQEVYKSEIINNTLNPTWKKVYLYYDDQNDTFSFANNHDEPISFKFEGDINNTTIMIQIWDHDIKILNMGKDDFMGESKWISYPTFFIGGPFSLLEENSDEHVKVNGKNSILIIENSPNPETMLKLQNQVGLL